MLPKKSRADKKAVDKVFEGGKFLNTFNLTFKFIRNSNQNPPRISFIVPKKVAKLAVARNALRRKGYRAIREIVPMFPLGLEGVFLFKKNIEPRTDIKEEIREVLKKIK